MKIEINPLYDRVIIKRIVDVADTTSGGIFIPEAAREKPQEGEVLAIGQGKYEDGVFRPLMVSVGDRVLFGKYAGSEMKLRDGQEVLIVREDEILGVINEIALNASIH